MKGKLLGLAMLPIVLALTAGSDSHYGSSGMGQLNVWAGGGSASAFAQTTAYSGIDVVTVEVSLTPSGSGCSGWVTASGEARGYTSAQADQPLGCNPTSATGAAYHTITDDYGWPETFSTYATAP